MLLSVLPQKSASAPLAPSASLGPAVFDQEQPDVASNGTDFVVVWIDRRSTGAEAPLFATRVGEDGRPIHAVGNKLADADDAARAARAGLERRDVSAARIGPQSNGSEYVLAWSEIGGRLRALRLNRVAYPHQWGRFSLAATASGTET